MLLKRIHILGLENEIVRSTGSQPSTQRLFGLATKGNAVEFAENLLIEQMSQKLFEITEKINRYVPKLPTPPLAGGIESKFIKPALEFVKAICHVLSLDPALEDIIASLKRSMLKLIGVGEFSEEAMWKDPSVSYVLPGVICKTCNHCRDVDLGKDSYKNIEDDE